MYTRNNKTKYEIWIVACRIIIIYKLLTDSVSWAALSRKYEIIVGGDKYDGQQSLEWLYVKSGPCPIVGAMCFAAIAGTMMPV